MTYIKTKNSLIALLLTAFAFIPTANVFAKAVDYTTTPKTDIFFGNVVSLHNYITITNGTTGTKNITLKGLNASSKYTLYTPAQSGSPSWSGTGVTQVTNALTNQPYASGYTLIERADVCTGTLSTCKTGATFYRTFTISSTVVTTTAEVPTQAYGYTILNSTPDDWNDMNASLDPLIGTITEHATAGNKVMVMYMGTNKGNIFYNATLGYMPFNPNAVPLTPSAGTYNYTDALGATVFTLIVDAAAPTGTSFTLPSTTGATISGTVTSFLSDGGIIRIVATFFAIPLAFIVIKRVIDLTKIKDGKKRKDKKA